MKISNHEIEHVVLNVAKETFGSTVFHRRPLMKAVEARLKMNGDWTADDDAKSGSAGEKSVGLAKVDWAISHLYEHGKLMKVGYDQWRAPHPECELIGGKQAAKLFAKHKADPEAADAIEGEIRKLHQDDEDELANRYRRSDRG